MSTKKGGAIRRASRNSLFGPCRQIETNDLQPCFQRSCKEVYSKIPVVWEKQESLSASRCARGGSIAPLPCPAIWPFVETRRARLFRIVWTSWLAIDFLLVEEANSFLSDEASSLVPEGYSDIITGFQDNDRVKPRSAVERWFLHGYGFDQDGPQSIYSGFSAAEQSRSQLQE